MLNICRDHLWWNVVFYPGGYHSQLSQGIHHYMYKVDTFLRWRTQLSHWFRLACFSASELCSGQTSLLGAQLNVHLTESLMLCQWKGRGEGDGGREEGAMASWLVCSGFWLEMNGFKHQLTEAVFVLTFICSLSGRNSYQPTGSLRTILHPIASRSMGERGETPVVTSWYRNLEKVMALWSWLL